MRELRMKGRAGPKKRRDYTEEKRSANLDDLVELLVLALARDDLLTVGHRSIQDLSRPRRRCDDEETRQRERQGQELKEALR